MKKFLSLQTKLHKGICNNRTVATIATHDREKIKGKVLKIKKKLFNENYNLILKITLNKIHEFNFKIPLIRTPSFHSKVTN